MLREHCLDRRGVIPAELLRNPFQEANPLVRANAAEALGKAGPVAADALPALEAAAEDEEGGVRTAAVRAVGR